MSSTLCAIRSKSARQPDELSWATEEPIDVSPADVDQLVPERLPLGKRVSRDGVRPSQPPQPRVMHEILSVRPAVKGSSLGPVGWG
jgi:hypothetical protein